MTERITPENRQKLRDIVIPNSMPFEPMTCRLLLSLLDERDELEQALSAKSLKCPKCDQGYAGRDCTDEAMECHYCDGHGNLTAAMFVDLKDRFEALVGDAMVEAHFKDNPTEEPISDPIEYLERYRNDCEARRLSIGHMCLITDLLCREESLKK